MVELTRTFREQPTPELARTAQRGVASAISRLQHALDPWTSYVFVPLFALANAGVHVSCDLLSRALASPIMLGILGGYLIGKPLGITSSAALACVCDSRRAGLSSPVIAAGGVVAGIGFTLPLLISTLAFHGREPAEAELGVLATPIAG